MNSAIGSGFGLGLTSRLCRLGLMPEGSSDSAPPVSDGSYFGRRFYGRRFFGARYFG